MGTTYSGPTWVNGGSPELSAANLQAMTDALESVYEGVNAVWATAAEYPGMDPTMATSSASALGTAMDDARGGTLVIPPGLYDIDARITTTLDDGDDLRVLAYGATFVCDVTSSSQGRMFRFANTVDTATTVSSVVESKTSGAPYGFNDIWITTLTVASTSGIAAGDYVRVVADDVVDGPDVTVRSGQTCKVIEVSGSDVIVSGRLRDSYTTSVRLARISSARLTWEGGTFTDSAAILAGGTGYGELIETRLLVRPTFKHTDFVNVMGPAFGIRHCLGWLIDDVHFRWLHNESSSAYGYGINSYGELGTATHVYAERVRHAYTTAAEVCGTGANIEQYGRAYGDRIIGGLAHATLATAWDTHGDGRGIQFIDCDAYDCESGFQLRGIYNIVRGGQVVGDCQSGVVIVNDASSGGESYGHDISGLTITGTTYRIFSVAHATYGPSTNPSYFHDCVIHDRDTSDPIFYADDSTLHHARIAVASGGTRTGTAGTATIAVMTEASDTA